MVSLQIQIHTHTLTPPTQKLLVSYSLPSPQVPPSPDPPSVWEVSQSSNFHSSSLTTPTPFLHRHPRSRFIRYNKKKSSPLPLTKVSSLIHFPLLRNPLPSLHPVVVCVTCHHPPEKLNQSLMYRTRQSQSWHKTRGQQEELRAVLLTEHRFRDKGE